MAAQPLKGRGMASLASLQGQGGGRIPIDGYSYNVSRQELTAIFEAMSTETSRALQRATQQGDLPTAQRLLREATVQYFTATPAAPAAALVTPRRSPRRLSHTPR